MAQSPKSPSLGLQAPDFKLPATDGGQYALADIKGENGTVVVFICNHCPFVRAITERLVKTAAILAERGVGFVAICSNDADYQPADSFENMVEFGKERGFNFPYLHDESQDVAREYGAECTPDFFGISAGGQIQYRGRLDEGRNRPLREDAPPELLDAMQIIADTGVGPEEQFFSVGCGIKWKQI